MIKKEIESRGFNSAQAQRIFQNAKIYMVREKVLFLFRTKITTSSYICCGKVVGNGTGK